MRRTLKPGRPQPPGASSTEVTWAAGGAEVLGQGPIAALEWQAGGLRWRSREMTVVCPLEEPVGRQTVGGAVALQDRRFEWRSG